MPSKAAQQMNALIHKAQPKNSPSVEKTQTILGLYKRGLQQLRSDRNMHPEARRVEIARLYTTTRASLTKVKHDQVQADKDNWGKLERKLWGYDDLRAGVYNTGDRAALDSTIRDATHRAAQLAKPGDAARALHAAEQSGDKVLARAIGKRACDMDWDDVLGDYLAPRSADTETYQQLGDIYQRQHTANGVLGQQFAASVAKPAELRDLGEKDIDAMTTTGDTDA